MADRTEIIPVKLPNGTIVKIEITPETTKEQNVAFTKSDIPYFKEVTGAIEGIVESITETLQRVKPDKATVKFGVDVSLEAGQLTALIAKGTGKANMELTLEWDKPKKEE